MAVCQRFFLLPLDRVDCLASGAISYTNVMSLLLLSMITIGLEMSPGGGGGLYPVDHMTWGIQTMEWDGEGVG